MAGSITPYDTASGKRYRVRYRKPNGAQTDKRGFKTKRDAELFLASVTVSKATGSYLDPAQSRRTVAVLAEQWKRGRLAGLKPSSREVMETAWRVHVEPRWGARAAGGIRPSEVEDWIAELGRTRGAQTVRRAVFVLSSVLTIAERDGVIAKNPTRGAQLPAKKRKPARYLTHQQVDELAAAAGEQGDVVLTLAYTGLRWGEVVALRVRHLDMLRRRLLIEDNAVRVDGIYEHGTPKSGQRREVPMPPFLIPTLARLCEGKGRDGFVFGAGTTPIPYPHSTSGWFVRAVEHCQHADPAFPTITPHDLRHTAASLAISAGANVKVVQRMLGHASAAMTLDVYADLFDDDLETVATAMSNARTTALA
jgi:integrase